MNNINFTVDGHTLDYDIKTSYMNAVRDTLASIYKEVEISSDYSAKSELIAIPYFSWTANSYNMGAEIITNSRIDILDGDTKQLIKSYHSKRTTYYSTPSPVLALNFLTGFSLFTLTPITMPMATDKMGVYGEGLLENTINESLSSIQSDLILDEKNTNAKIGTIGQESNSTDSSGSGFVVAPNMMLKNTHQATFVRSYRNVTSNKSKRRLSTIICFKWPRKFSAYSSECRTWRRHHASRLPFIRLIINRLNCDEWPSKLSSRNRK